MNQSGILTILHDCLFFLSQYAKANNIRIIALVPSASLINIPGIEYHEFPKSKRSWFLRLYYEFYFFRKLSQQIRPDVWLSLHDITPNVTAPRKFVYWHNPTPFFHPKLKDWRFGFKICVFSMLYKYVYRIHAESNTAIIVQQKWIKDAFRKMYGLNNIVTAAPEVHHISSELKLNLDQNKIHFFYPAYPRTFKNFETVCKAVEMLPMEIRSRIMIHLTLKDENSYARHIYSSYQHLPEIVFTGVLTRAEVAAYYNSCDALVFASRLETWGLPLSEIQHYEKPVFASDLPYAHESLSGYDKMWFFAAEQPEELAGLITKYVNSTLPTSIKSERIGSDFLTWNSMFNYIFSE
jgi:glycosyltransferase involved in cell wall biosynthesis